MTFWESWIVPFERSLFKITKGWEPLHTIRVIFQKYDAATELDRPKYKFQAKPINIILYYHLFIWPPVGALNARANPSASVECKNIIHQRSGTDGRLEHHSLLSRTRYGNNNDKIKKKIARRLELLTNWALQRKSYDVFINIVTYRKKNIQ